MQMHCQLCHEMAPLSKGGKGGRAPRRPKQEKPQRLETVAHVTGADWDLSVEEGSHCKNNAVLDEEEERDALRRQCRRSYNEWQI